MEKELRSLDIVSREDTEDMILEGYALVFGEPTMIGTEERGFYEVIDRKALDGADLKDVPLKWNHSDTPFVLARTRNKSLELKVDEKGLFIRAKLLPDVQQHRDIYSMVKNGLVDRMSFAFSIDEHIIDRSGKVPTRTITKIGKVWDVSAVTTPAYDATEIHARSLDLVETELKKLLDSETEKRSLEKELENQKALELEKLKVQIKLSLK